jgi:UDP-N-acetyl-D-galactosamine dehydrogenase
LAEYTNNITIYDPWADKNHVNHEYGINLFDGEYDDLKGKFDAVILGVAHHEFKDKNIRELLKDNTKGVVYDVKGVIDRNLIDGRL